MPAIPWSEPARYTTARSPAAVERRQQTDVTVPGALSGSSNPSARQTSTDRISFSCGSSLIDRTSLQPCGGRVSTATPPAQGFGGDVHQAARQHPRARNDDRVEWLVRQVRPLL